MNNKKTHVEKRNMNKRDLWTLFCEDRNVVAEELENLKDSRIITQSQAAHWGLNLGIIKDESLEMNDLKNMEDSIKGIKE